MLIRFYGDSVLNIKDRLFVNDISIVVQYEKCVGFFDKHISKGDLIQGAYRTPFEEIPLIAFREAVANAIVHRSYSVEADIKIEIFDSRIEIVSPGGLPEGISEEEFLDGRISICRNKTISNIFVKMGIIERLATGIRRIKESYKESATNPEFIIGKNTVKVVLPILKIEKSIIKTGFSVYDSDNLMGLDNEYNSYDRVSEALIKEEKLLLRYMKKNKQVSRSKAEEILLLKKTQTVHVLNKLIEKGIIFKAGKGNKTYYVLK
jgi:ATP-dependent DNA helicase RecG